MRKNKFAVRLISFLLTTVMVFGMFGSSALGADESDYVADFRITTDKASVKKDEEVMVSVKLKTNYYICAMSLAVLYDCEAFAVQNTSELNLSSFLTFTGSMADTYLTNGNWKSPSSFYTRRNSNTAFWSREDVMNKYKIVYATWSADTSMSYELVRLDEEETVITFELKANKDIANVSKLIFMSLDFQKTSSAPLGLLFVGRSTTQEFSSQNMISTGQTINYDGKSPFDEEISASLSPADGTSTVVDKENGLIYGLEEGIYELEPFIKVEGYTLRYTYDANGFLGTGTKVECLLDGEVKETYYVVIFGDLSGDAVIDTYDTAIIAAAVNSDIELDNIRSLAADIFVDEVVDTYDYALLAQAVNGDRVISQNKE